MDEMLEENLDFKYKKGRPPENNRPVKVVETGEIFSNYREAASAIGGNRGCVFQCLEGWRTQHLGRSFQYADGGSEGAKNDEKN